MSKQHHPQSRAERLRLKKKKDKFDYSVDRAGHVQRRLAEEALEQKEAFDDLRREILQAEEHQETREEERLHRTNSGTEPYRTRGSSPSPSNVSDQ